MKGTGPGTALFGSAEPRRLAWLLGMLLVLVALALNARVTGFDFLYLRDDDVNVALNPHMGGLGAERLRWMYTDWSYARRYIPLGWLGFSATYSLSGLDPLLYHLAGLSLYLLNTALVLVLALHAVRLAGTGSRDRGLGRWEVLAASLAAGWWCLSPLRVETTAWVSGNLYGQATAFLVLSAVAYLRSWLCQGTTRTAWIALSSASYLASLLTYPIALGVPFVFAGIDLILRRSRPSAPLRRLLAEKAAFFAPLGVVLALTLVARVQGAAMYGDVPGLGEAPLSARAAQGAYLAGYYVWKPWWPLNLSPLYDTLASVEPWRPRFALSLACVLGASLAAALSARRRPWIAVAWFGYLAVMVPYMGLTERVAMASDRYACVPMVMMACAVAVGVSGLGRRGPRTLVAAALAAFLAWLGLLTSAQLDVWRDDTVLHQYVLTVLGDTPLRDDFLGRKAILDFMRGREAEATAQARSFHEAHPASTAFLKAEAIMADKRRIAPYYGRVPLLAILQEQMGLSFARSGRPAEADEHFRYALRMDERFYQAAFDRSLVLLSLGRSRDALGCFLQAERWAPGPLPAVQRRAFLLGLRSLAESQADRGLSAAALAALGRSGRL